MIPGEYILKKEPIICNEKQVSIPLKVTNTGDRPIQVGSHFHFFEANKYLSFDREKALGHRLDILSGTAKRFEPGETMEVNIIPITGKKMLYGANNLVQGKLSKATNLKKMKDNKFKHQK